MVALVIGLAAAILTDHSRSRLAGASSGHCWQHSISVYYCTPVPSFPVGSLVALGINLIALKDSTELEDALLNFAGILAPVSEPAAHAHTDEEAQQKKAAEKTAHQAAVGGYPLAPALFIAAWTAFFADRVWFNAKAHWRAEIAMSAFTFLAVLNNAIGFCLTRERSKTGTAPSGIRFNWYLVIALLMIAAPLITEATPWPGAYDPIWLEASRLHTVRRLLGDPDLGTVGLRTTPSHRRTARYVSRGGFGEWRRCCAPVQLNSCPSCLASTLSPDTVGSFDGNGQWTARREQNTNPRLPRAAHGNATWSGVDWLRVPFRVAVTQPS